MEKVTLRLETGAGHNADVDLVIWQDEDSLTRLTLCLSHEFGYTEDVGIGFKNKPNEVVERLKKAFKNLDNVDHPDTKLRKQFPSYEIGS